MKFFRNSPRVRRRYVAAVAAGLLGWTVAFPKFDVAGFAWIAPGLMVAAALGQPGPERRRTGYVAGLAHYLSMLYWLLFIPYRWHGIPLGPALGWIALSGFVALFTATWVWLATSPAGLELRRPRLAAKGASSTATETVLSPEPELVRGYGADLPRSWLGRTLWAMFGAASWVAMEMVLASILGGFPWTLLGV